MARGTGARGLRSVLEGLLQRTMFDLPSIAGVTGCRVDAAAVEEGGGLALISDLPESDFSSRLTD
jgi:ATP-dependent Clp protease ATP-binding subunit ClpX